MKRVICFFLSWLALYSIGHAASFDCGKASSKIEKFICESPNLSALDEGLDKAYKLAQSNSNHEDVQLLIKDQRQWLKSTRNSCGDEACLAQAYSSRIEAIKPASGNTVHPLTKIVSIESMAPVGNGYPEDIRQIDGDLVYSHYDNSGNEKNIVNFDFTRGLWFNWVEGKKDPKLIAHDSRYIIFHTPNSASFPIEAINRNTGASLSKIKLKSSVQEAFIEGDRLVLFQASPAPPYGYRQAIAILQLPSLKLIKETSIPGGALISLYGNRIYTAYSANTAMDLMVYNHQFKELGRLKIPPPLEKINSYCQPQIVQNEGDRAVLITNCGEMHVLDLKSFSVERSIPRYSHFYSTALYKGLIFTTTEKQNGIVVFDMNSAAEVARFPIPASYLFIKGDILLAAEAPVNRLKDSSWPMQTYRINADSIRSGEWKNQSIINACSEASQAIQNGDDIYQAARLCEDSGIHGVINSGNIPADVLPHVVNYATWLSQTLHRYDESLHIFDKLRKLGAEANPEAVNEAILKKNVFDAAIDLKTLNINSSGTFAKALKLGLNQKPTRTIQLPKLEGQLRFIDKNIYAPRWGCSPNPDGGGVGIEVYNRDTFNHITWLKVYDCDEEQQDNIEAITADKSKLYVRTGFRYPDETRTNYFVFDKSSWKLVTQKVFSSSTDAFPQIGTEKKYPAQYSGQEGDITTKSYRVHREYMTNSSPGNTKYIFNEINPSANSSDKTPSFVMQGTSISTPIAIPNKDEVIFIGNPDDMRRLSLIRFDPVTSESLTFAVLPSISSWAIDDKSFYVSNGMDIMIFDLSNFVLKEVIPRIFWNDENETRPASGTHAATIMSNERRITNIYIDRGRMIVRTLYGTSYVFDVPNEM